MRRLEYITELMLKYMDGDVDAEKRLDELEDEDFMNEKIEEYLVENGIAANNFDRYKYLHDYIQKKFTELANKNSSISAMAFFSSHDGRMTTWT